MKNRILEKVIVSATVIITFASLVLCGIGWKINIRQQEEFLQERTALMAELTANQNLLKEKECSEQKLQALQKETKIALSLEDKENNQLRKNIDDLNVKLQKEENGTGKLLSELNDSEFRLQTASASLKRAQEETGKLRNYSIELDTDLAYLKGKFENKGIALKSLESYAFGDTEIKNPAVSVKLILFIPKDCDAPKLKDDQENIKEGLKIAQPWFLKKIGATFKFSDPIIFKGEKPL
ncbi:MAG: hypothetical protein ABIG29_03635 [Candidatus Nealsonbacteria bacterium]